MQRKSFANSKISRYYVDMKTVTPRGGYRENSGRKPRVKGEVSTGTKSIRHTDAELYAWLRAAKGKPLHEWMRDTLNTAARFRP